MVIDRIKSKLASALAPSVLQVLDESYKHAGHHGAPQGANGETHFHVTIVSAAFAGLSRIKRHQKIYQILAEELKHPVHALSLQTLTADEYTG